MNQLFKEYVPVSTMFDMRLAAIPSVDRILQDPRLAPERLKPEALGAAPRVLPVPVIGRIHEDAVWLEERTLEDEAAFIAQLEGTRL